MKQEEEDKTWKPENYGKRFHGIVSLREAFDPFAQPRDRSLAGQSRNSERDRFFQDRGCR